MNGWQIALLVGLILAVDLAVIGAVVSICAMTIRPLVTAFPPVNPTHDAVHRRWQSFRFDMMNFGGCVHVWADERFLHLRPVWLARRFGLQDMSVPWSEFQQTSINGKWAESKLRGVTVRGPAWCLSLAAPQR